MFEITSNPPLSAPTSTTPREPLAAPPMGGFSPSPDLMDQWRQPGAAEGVDQRPFHERRAELREQRRNLVRRAIGPVLLRGIEFDHARTARARLLARLCTREVQSLPQAPPGEQLTDRETEILKMVAKGLSYKQIAERLVLSHRTVQNHVQNTLRKLQMHNRVELTRYAIEQGLDED